jgi:MscS family membrane protein
VQAREILTEVLQSWAVWWASLDLQNIFFAIVVALPLMMFRRLIARLSVRCVRLIFGSIGTEMPETIEKTLEPAMSVLVTGISFLLGVLILDLPAAPKEFFIKLAESICLMAVFSGSNGFLDSIENATDSYKTRRANLEVVWIVRIFRISSAIITLALILRVWGIDIAALLTGLGVLGAALAFILQDLLRNFVAGLNNSNENRFTVGDWIRVDGIADGVVIATGLRSTVIRAFDLSIVQVPNQELANRALTNFSRRPHRRIFWEVDLTYSTTTEQLANICQAVNGFIADSDDFVETPISPRFVRIEAFGPSSIKIMVYCFTRTNEWGEFLRSKEKLAIAIKRIVEEAGASFALPSRSIYLEKSDPGEVRREAMLRMGTK